MKTPFGAAAPDFDHPVAMLVACHERIEDRCHLLHRLFDHLANNAQDDQARQAAASLLRYFDTAGEHHHQDEEQDLFPRLLAADARRAGKLVALLRSDHAVMRTLWTQLRPPLLELADGRPARLERSLVDRFTMLYREHIAVEESQLFPLACEILDDEAIAVIGASMARRRGVER